MKLLLIDTTTEKLMLAIADKDGIIHRIVQDGERHNSAIMQCIDSLINEAGITPSQLDAVCVAVGPGSFTGIRIGVTVANGFAYALGIKIINVLTTDIYARPFEAEAFITAIDARNDVYYYAEYKGNYRGRVYIGECLTKFLSQYNGEKVLASNVKADVYLNSLALIAVEKYERGEFSALAEAFYLKKSQAEREKAMRESEYYITDVTSAHVTALQAIDEECFPSFPMSEQYLAGDVYSPIRQYLAIIVNNNPIGFASFTTILDEAHVLDVAITAPYRGKGYGRVLMNSLIERAKRLNLKRMTLEVNTKNNVAISLYESLGFTKEGQRDKYYNNIDDAGLYWLTLE